MSEAAPLAPLPPGAAEMLTPVAEGMGLLIRLLDREADADLIAGLNSMGAGGFFAALLPGETGAEIARVLDATLAEIEDPTDPDMLDELAADYADCFLTHGRRLSPNGSVWMTEERLERQEPMFAVRDWYAHYGLETPNWRIRSDDHLVHELQFVQHLLTLATPEASHDAAHFMDRHLLPWAPEFGRQLASRAATPLIAVSGALLDDYLRMLRELLTEITGIAPDIAPLPGDKPNPKAPEQQLYIPGVAESW
ncbi:MAG TPA: molecular chaperone TorD family protein [Paracoccus sp. (in: a-proteobacteria)]|uniref:TorD/DmsD family molecular chaperone n=1 Tax=uncultured Paracoccus sp. TaxID=189685 RepID=UPI00262C4C64|nr:molecular chaperone TorD family protein [uncultured Paracoccus sp.]HMQ40633.1 molecular chaperone TorD family protein [Paracoccus sp. (in: a-proteobacteria)]HMR36590.1 molecular chaperone TorD family protein [Paracoccus sp. (in: a-proteobacteria)]